MRAQLRSCVFKAIDNQDQVESKKSSFHWENPLARKLRQDDQATFAAEIIKEFMEFYRLNYSLAIFGPEANMGNARTADREALGKKAGLKCGEDKPILVQILEALAMKGDSKPAQPASADVPKMEALRQP